MLQLKWQAYIFTQRDNTNTTTNNNIDIIILQIMYRHVQITMLLIVTGVSAGVTGGTAAWYWAEDILLMCTT